MLESYLSSMSEAEASRLGAATRSLIAASFAPSAERIERAESAIMLGTLERVRKVIHAHLMSPQLGPAFLAREVGMSRSRLYRLFECYGGVDRYIKAQRLLKAFQLLSDPMQRASIQTIAADLQFADASSFSRAFKSEFDCSPSDVRNAAMCGALASPMSRAQQQKTSSRFSDLFMNG
jgi:AraC-like DNA-binding protein